MKIFIIGASGFLGAKLAIDIKNKSTGSGIVPVSSRKYRSALLLDLRQADEFNYEDIKPFDFIIFLASISSPDACLNDYENAYKINVVGTIKFIERSLQRGARVLFFSSDNVYGESISESDIFNEDSICRPVSAYGKMKHAVEEKFKVRNNFKSLRLSYVFSGDDKYSAYIQKCSLENIVAEIYHPFYRNLVYYHDLLDTLLVLIKDWDRFLIKNINVCGEENLSRIVLAELYKKYIDKSLEYQLVTPNDSYFKARPQRINLRSKYNLSICLIIN